MPYYNYICKSCDKTFNLYVSVDDMDSRDEQYCPDCEQCIERVLFNSNLNFGGVKIDESSTDKDDYATVKRRLHKSIEEKRRDLERYRKEVKEELDNL